MSAAVKPARPAFYAGGRRYRLGNKKVYLPTQVVSMVHPSKHAPTTMCSFKVPLNMNKLDMRDYLYNLYSTPTLSVRSHTLPTPARRETHAVSGKPYGPFRYKAFTKIMTVELTRPFVFPKMVADLSPWDQDMTVAMKDSREVITSKQENDYNDRLNPVGIEPENAGERRVTAAKVIRRGEWGNGVELDERWKRIERLEREKAAAKAKAAKK